MGKYKLLYFNAKALGEPIRFLFLYGNIPFEDYRYEFEEWTTVLKPKAPFGQGPLLEIDGKTYWQSVAIQRHVAELAGLAGSDNLQKLRIDMIAESVWDVRCLLYKYFFADPVTKAESKDRVFNELLPDMMTKLDKFVAENGGYFVDGELTWPDLMYTAYYEYLNHMAGRDIEGDSCPHLKTLRGKVWQLPRIKEYLAKREETEW